MADIIEDIFAFLYATGGKKKPSSDDVNGICPLCGLEMEYDDENDDIRCPDCDE